MMIRVMLADDHPIVRHGIKAYLDAQPDVVVVAEADDGPGALAQLQAVAVDVSVVDLSLPFLGGLDLIRVLRASHPEVALVVFTLQPEDALALHFLDAGALAFLSKDRSAPELGAAIRNAAVGKPTWTSRLTDVAVGRTPGQPHHQLSAREAQVFALLLRGASVQDMAATLEISSSTTSNHLSSIRDKLGVTSNGEVLLYAHRAGLLG